MSNELERRIRLMELKIDELRLMKPPSLNRKPGYTFTDARMKIEDLEEHINELRRRYLPPIES